jgi:hypothetical protein
MGFFNRPSPHAAARDAYLNSAQGQAALKQSKVLTAKYRDDKRAKLDAERSKRDMARDAAKKKLQAEDALLTEQRAKEAAERAFDEVMSGGVVTTPIAPEKPVVEENDLLKDALAFGAALLLGGTVFAQGSSRRDTTAEHSDEMAQAITEQSRAALDEMASHRLTGHVSWSECPDLCELFRGVETTAQWRADADEEEESVRDEFEMCLSNAAGRMALIGSGEELVTAQASSLYRLYVQWQKSLFK